jgi:geranylgeranyl diphosphate synthase type I
LANPALDIAGEWVQTLPAILQGYRSDINSALRNRLAGYSLPVYQILRYSMGWSDVDGNPRAATEGKALRPSLCLLACEATGGQRRKALPAAVSLELIHNFSLIHDDIQDRDETRHHRPTAWSVWGEPKALVAGNVLRVVADVSLWDLLEEGVTSEEALEATGLLTEAYLEMIEGQYLDLSYEGRPDIGMNEYLNMISKKTGALIRCALNVGAAIGTRDRAIVQAFRECGRSLGFVFQIRDDALGIWGNPDTTGKPVGADIRRKKNTLPVVYAMSRSRGKDKDLLMNIYREPRVSDTQVATVLDILEDVKAKEYAENLASEHCEIALESLSTVEMAAEARDDILEIAHFLLVRQH